MTTADLLALIWRWRVLVPLGVMVSVAALLHVREAEPVYWSQTELRVIAPADAVASNTLTSSSQSLISMAGLVVREIDQGDRPVLSDSADLPGLGVRDGWQLRVPNAGGQWEPNFSRPVIDVQVVGATRAEVEKTRGELTLRVTRELDSLQATDGIPSDSRMAIHADTPLPPVVKMSGSRARAELVTVALGVWVTLAAVLAAEPVACSLRRLGARALRRRRRSSRLVSAV